MSVIRNSTHLNLSNTTNKFIEITVDADQHSSFRILHKSNYIVEKQNETTHNSLFAWALHSITNWSRGSSMSSVTINLPAKETVECDINSNGSLQFTSSIKEKNTYDHTEGSMVIPPETQGHELHIVFTETMGIGYKKNGDIALGLNDIDSQSIVVASQIKTMEGHPIELPENEASVCRVKIG